MKGAEAPTNRRNPEVYLRRAFLNYWPFMVLFILWDAFVSFFKVNSIVCPSPFDVLREMALNSPLYIHASYDTIFLAVPSLAAGIILGTIFAILCWASPFAAGILAPMSALFTSVPIVIFIPLIARVSGYGQPTVFAIVTILSFFPIFVFTLKGLKAHRPLDNDLFTAFGASSSRRCFLLILPSALPSWVAGLRVAAPFAVLSAMLAEFLMGSRGLGHVFRAAAATFDTQSAFGASAVATIISVSSFTFAQRLERYVASRWN